MTRRTSVTLLLLSLVMSACTSSSGGVEDVAAPEVAATATTVEPTPGRVVTGTAGGLLPRPTLAPLPTVARETVDAVLAAKPAPTGTFVVAKPEGGIPTVLPPWRDGQAALEIPVYDEPFGEPRVQVYMSMLDGLLGRYPLVHTGADGPPLVLRVLAGGPGDEWIRVQGLEHGQAVWVQSLYFDFGFTPIRVEIDLAGSGHLRLIEGGAIILESPISKGRAGHPTPTGLTYITGGGGSAGIGSGAARLDLAMFRPMASDPERTRIFLRSAGLEEVGSATSFGDVRIPNSIIGDLAQRIGPGTPVLIFDSLHSWSTAATVASRPVEPAMTLSFSDSEIRVLDETLILVEYLWERCAPRDGLVCPVAGESRPETLVPVGNVFLTAKPDAGQELVGVGDVVPVYDEPGGPKRMLVDRNEIDGIELAYPLFHPSLFGEPLVVRVLEGAPGDEWVLVQAPVRPHRQSVWVRAEDFVWGQTLKRFEIDLARDGLVTLFDDDDEVISSEAAYGRDSRPTTLHDTYVEQAFRGDKLSPAYGTYILTLASYSETLGTYGGGMPGQSLHGTNQPELIGQRVSGGGIRVPNEIIDFIYVQPGIVGANVIIFDSSSIGREAAIQLQRSQTWFPARTTTFPRTNLPFAGAHSYS